MGILNRRFALPLLLFLVGAAGKLTRAGDEEVARLVERIRAVAAEGRGNVEASAASQRLARLGPDALPEVLVALEGADPIASNWLRAAVDTIAERSLAQGKALPRTKLETFVLDRRHSGRVRRLAYEWLARADPSAPERLIPGMLTDPAAELRRDAVARELRVAQKLLDEGKGPEALVAYRKLFPFSRDEDQVKQIATVLEKQGEPVDLTRHFGFIQQWRLIGPFDNTDKKGYDFAYPPEKEVDFTGEYKGKGSTVGWLEHVTTDLYGVVNFNKVLGKNKSAVAYAVAEIESEVERPVHIRASSHNAVKIWLNGELLFTCNAYHRGIRMDQYQTRGTLRAGRNAIRVKVCEDAQPESWAQEWMFQLRVCDETGGGLR